MAAGEPSPALAPDTLYAAILAVTSRGTAPTVVPAFAAIVRDIAGGSLAFDPAWRTAAALGIAGRAYESRDFTALPVLADAIQDAGCEDASVLDHRRRPDAVHARGCWVVDAVLGKG